MLPETPTARKAAQRHQTWMSQCETLEDLAAELRRYAINAALIPDQRVPYVRVHLPGTASDRVDLSLRDGDEVYAWSSPHGQHPAIDPVGCARRLATQLHREQLPGSVA